MIETLTFRSADHPQAKNGSPGEEYSVLFPLEDGRELVIQFGEQRHRLLLEILGLAPKAKRKRKKPASQ